MKRLTSQVLIIFISSVLILQFSSCNKEKEQKEADKVYISGVSSSVSPDDEKEGVRKTYSLMPGVPFSHNGHEKKNIRCIECHHKKNNDSRVKKCSSCHKGSQGAEVLHQFCITCHDKRKGGPLKCEGCHDEEIKKTISQNAKADYKSEGIFSSPFHAVHEKNKTACSVCHHKEGESDKMRKCSLCHKGEPRIQIMHAFCRDCHETNKKGPVVCRECHKK